MEAKIREETFHLKKGMPYFPISVKTQQNVQGPFLWMLRKLTGHSSLVCEPEYHWKNKTLLTSAEWDAISSDAP